jgi:hypothetical protein
MTSFVPAGTRLWTSLLVLLIGAGAGVLVAKLAGFVAGRRASRVRPTEALAEASVERRWPHPVRVVLGIIALGGAVTLGITTLGQNADPNQQVSNALFTLLVSMVAVAFLGPLLVAAAELILRLPLRLLSGAAGRLALAGRLAAVPRGFRDRPGRPGALGSGPARWQQLAVGGQLAVRSACAAGAERVSEVVRDQPADTAAEVAELACTRLMSMTPNSPHEGTRKVTWQPT